MQFCPLYLSAAMYNIISTDCGRNGKFESLTSRSAQQHAAVHGERQTDSSDVLGEDAEYILGSLRQTRRHVVRVVWLDTGYLVPRWSAHLTSLDDVGTDGSTTVRRGREPRQGGTVFRDVNCLQGTSWECRLLCRTQNKTVGAEYLAWLYDMIQQLVVVISKVYTR